MTNRYVLSSECNNGEYVGVERDCNDGNPCTTDTCHRGWVVNTLIARILVTMAMPVCGRR